MERVLGTRADETTLYLLMEKSKNCDFGKGLAIKVIITAICKGPNHPKGTNKKIMVSDKKFNNKFKESMKAFLLCDTDDGSAL